MSMGTVKMLIKSLNILLFIVSALSFVFAEQTRNTTVTRALTDGPHHAADYLHSHSVTTSSTIVETVDSDNGDGKAISHSSGLVTSLWTRQAHENIAPAYQRHRKFPRPQGRAPPRFA